MMPSARKMYPNGILIGIHPFMVPVMIDSVVIISSAEEEEAEWIIKRIPVIQREYEDIALREENFDVISSLQLGIVHSIVQALRYMHTQDKKCH